MIRPARGIKITTLVILLACTGCARVAYDSLRENQAMRCRVRLTGMTV